MNGGKWVKLDDGTLSTAPIVRGSGSPTTDEEALNIAIAGYGGERV